MSTSKPNKIDNEEMILYDKNLKDDISIGKAFTCVRDPYTGLLYKIPLRGINNESVYHNDPNANYLDNPNAKFNYDYMYYAKECIFDQYKIPNIVQRINQTDNYCPAECMNYRTFNNYPENINDYRQRPIYDSNCLIFWAPVATERIDPRMEKGRYWVSTAGNIWDSKLNCPGRLLYHYKGYYDLEYSCNSGRYHKRKVHRIVMMTFSYIEGCEQLDVNHKDGNGLNNHITNLEWCTHQENVQHAIDNGFYLYQRCQDEYGISYKDYLNNKCLEHYGMTLSEVGRDREARKRM